MYTGCRRPLLLTLSITGQPLLEVSSAGQVTNAGGRFCNRVVPRRAFPAYIHLRRARSRRDGFDGVKVSGHDNWGGLIQAMNDSAR
jgi:hypothetical protein